jgi:hypothetical protein
MVYDQASLLNMISLQKMYKFLSYLVFFQRLNTVWILLPAFLISRKNKSWGKNYFWTKMMSRQIY